MLWALAVYTPPILGHMSRCACSVMVVFRRRRTLDFSPTSPPSPQSSPLVALRCFLVSTKSGNVASPCSFSFACSFTVTHTVCRGVCALVVAIEVFDPPFSASFFIAPASFPVTPFAFPVTITITILRVEAIQYKGNITTA